MPAQLSTARAKSEVLEKQTSTARQNIVQLESSLAENAKTVEGLQKEVEQEKKVTTEYQKTIADMRSRAKGNLTLLEARSIIWSDITSAIIEQWEFLETIGEHRSAIPYLSRKLQEAGVDLPNRAQHAEDYISFLYELRANDL